MKPESEYKRILKKLLPRPQVGFRGENKDYHRVPQYLYPSLERHKRMFGPSDRKEAVNEKDREPAVILQDLPQADLPLREDVKTDCNQGKIETGIH